MSLSAPFWLLLLVLLPALLYLARGASRGVRVWLAALLALVALAAAGPHAGTRPAGRRIFLLIDRSASFRAVRQWRAAEALAGRLAPADRVWIVVYGRRPALAAGPVAPAALAGALAAVEGAVVDPAKSSLADALQFTAALDPRPGEILLFGDGLDSPPARLWLAPPGKRVVVVAPPEQADLRIAGVRLPLVLPGVRFGVAVEIAGTAAGRGAVRLRRAGAVVATAPVELPGAGRVTLLLSDLIDRPGWVDWEVELVAEGPELTRENNRFPLRRLVGKKPGVLWIGRGRPGPWDALLAGQLALQHAGPAALADSHLVDVRAVVLDDLPAERLDPAVEARLARFADGGGGLLFLGGRKSLAGGGWIGRPLERRLPVWLRPRERPAPPAAVSVLVDCSGSMEPRLELARRALVELIDGLPDGTRLSVWAVAIPHDRLLGPVVLGPRREALREGLALFARGGTLFGPVLRAARAELLAAPEAERHLLLVSDGQTSETAAQLEAGDLSGIAVTGLLLDPAPSPLLSRLLERAGAVVHPVERAEELPRLLLARYRQRRWGLVARGAQPVSVGPQREKLGELAALEFPALAGCARVAARRGAQVLLQAGSIPLYARIEGGGRAAYLGLDFDGPWGAAYRSWPHTGNLLAQAVLWAAGGRETGEVEFQARFADGLVRLSAAPREAGVPRRLLVLARDGGDAQRVALQPRRPGLYRGSLELPPGRVWRIELFDAARPGVPLAVRQVGVPYGPELARLEPAREALSELARASGGRVVRGVADYLPADPPARPGRPLASLFWLAAAGLLLLGVALGRIGGQRSPR